MKLLLNFLETHSVNYALINGYLTVFLLIAIIFIIALYLRLKEAKTWIKFSDIEKKQNQHELKEEKSFCETQGSMYSKLLVKYADIKKAFEDAVAEITELRSKVKQLELKVFSINEENKSLSDRCDNLLTNVTYWKERALHQKHSKPVKQVESEWWEAKTNPYGFFIKGNVYKQDKTIKTDDSLIWIFLNENDLHSHLVERKYFKPVVK